MGQAAQVSCIATIFLYAYPCLCCSHLHTDMSNFYPHEGILYVRIQHLVSQKWGSSSDISKALARLGTSSKSSAALGLAGNARDGKWVPAQVAPQCVRSAHKKTCASAMATAAAALQLQWDPRTAVDVERSFSFYKLARSEKQLALTDHHHIGRISFAMNGLVPPVQP